MSQIVTIAVCADEAFALNGTIAVLSASHNLASESRIFAYLVDTGISDPVRRRMERVLEHHSVKYAWLDVDQALLDSLPLPPASWLSKATFARILLPESVPSCVRRLIYLDSDTLITGDLTELAKTQIDNNCAAACSGIKYPAVSYCRSSAVLCELGMQPDDRYFNAGVMLMNTSNWRDLGITNRAIALVREFGRSFVYADQDALNIALREQWVALDPSWNVATPVFSSAAAKGEVAGIKAKIIHFTGPNPGTPRCEHPRERLFLREVRRSGWFSRIEYVRWRLEVRAARLCCKLLKFVPRRARAGVSNTQ